jgi:hypothetical protein
MAVAPCGICGRGDSNPHPFRDAVLSRARLPFRHFRVERRLTHRMWNLVFTTLPFFFRALYHADTSFMGTHRRSSLR